MVIISVIVVIIRICFLHVLYNRLIDYYNARMLPMVTMCMAGISSLL